MSLLVGNAFYALHTFQGEVAAFMTKLLQECDEASYLVETTLGISKEFNGSYDAIQWLLLVINKIYPIVSLPLLSFV